MCACVYVCMYICVLCRYVLMAICFAVAALYAHDSQLCTSLFCVCVYVCVCACVFVCVKERGEGAGKLQQWRVKLCHPQVALSS